jgi:hypothetical protein
VVVFGETVRSVEDRQVPVRIFVQAHHRADKMGAQRSAGFAE